MVTHLIIQSTSALGLTSLLFWPPLVYLLWSHYIWNANSRFWRMFFYAWWGLLSFNGVGIFIPGVLDTLKFTNALVAHSHLAMAGMVSCLNMLILCELGSDSSTIRVLCNRSAFKLEYGMLGFRFRNDLSRLARGQQSCSGLHC